MPEQSSFLDSNAFVYVAITAVVGIISISMLHSIPYDDRMQLIFNAIYHSNVDQQKMNQLIKELPNDKDMRATFAYFYAKAALSVKVLMIVAYGFFIAIIKHKIDLAKSIETKVVSARDYHAARRLVFLSLVIMPFFYITAPIEYHINLSIDMTKHLFAGMNATIAYYSTQMLMSNKPKKL